MNIKTFKFYVANTATTRKMYDDSYWKDFVDEADRLMPVSTPEEIDNTINDFLSTLKTRNEFTSKCGNVIDIKINDFVAHEHNNGGSNLVVRTYTIIYN